jgi:hypothetical protein
VGRPELFSASADRVELSFSHVEALMGRSLPRIAAFRDWLLLEAAADHRQSIGMPCINDAPRQVRAA